MKMIRIVLCFGLWLPAVGAAETIYRCAAETGVPMYQQGPCAGGEGDEITLSAPAARWDALRPGEKKLLKRHQQKPKLRKPAKRRARDPGVLGRDCLQKRQRREAISAKLRRGYKPPQGERLRRRRNDLDEFIRLYCD